MNRPLIGLILGGVLGLFDGSTSFFTAPELRSEFVGIILGSTFKGVIAGLLTGLIARKTGSLGVGITVGLGVALVLAAPIAYLNVQHYQDPSIYWKIILPGAVAGMAIGYGTVRFGKPPASKEQV